MIEPFIPGTNPSVMDYLVHVWTHHREPFDRLLMRPIPELATETRMRADGTPWLDENGEPEQWWVNVETVSKAIERRYGRELLARDFLVPLARELDAMEALFAAAQTIVPLDANLAKRLEARQRMLSAFELRHLAGLMWTSEYSVEWPSWRSNAAPEVVYEGDFGRYEQIPKWLLKIYSKFGDDSLMIEINTENDLREKLGAVLRASSIDEGAKATITQEIALQHCYAEGWKDGFSEQYLAGVEAGREAGKRY